jgi:hypothetical protein
MLSPEEQLPPTGPGHPRRFRLTLGGVFAAILAICTLVGAAAIFYPRLVVDPEQQEIDRYNTDHLSFKIRNTGYIPLFNVTPMLGVCDIA